MFDMARSPMKAALIAAFTVGLVLMLVHPPSLSGLPGLLAWIGGGVALMLLTAWGMVALMGDDGPSEQQFDRIVERSEALARLPVPELPPDEFDELVTRAIDDLPPEFRDLLESTPVVISGRGREYRAYGHYIGDTVARDDHPDRIIIYRDTLERDFGHDPDLLRAQVTRTVRHELAHHLGWNEEGVERLGL
ncbi:MAG TPA: metallopeptidase family protein [Thermoleophilaceae bacterium]|nr:metallopeptidase family protein [Thermoleophilaceae bacterium]